MEISTTLDYLQIDPQLDLDGPLLDHVANTPDEEQSIIFGQGFGVITDIKAGPDGYLYILGYDGTIYRIT